MMSASELVSLKIEVLGEEFTLIEYEPPYNCNDGNHKLTFTDGCYGTIIIYSRPGSEFLAKFRKLSIDAIR